MRIPVGERLQIVVKIGKPLKPTKFRQVTSIGWAAIGLLVTLKNRSMQTFSQGQPVLTRTQLSYDNVDLVLLDVPFNFIGKS